MSVPRTVLITISTRQREVDAVADADIPIFELLGPVAAMLGVRASDIAVTVARSGEPTMTFSAQLNDTLAQSGVIDGDRVILHPFSQPPGRATSLPWSDDAPPALAPAGAPSGSRAATPGVDG